MNMKTKRNLIVAALTLVLTGPAWLTSTPAAAAGPATKPCRPGAGTCLVQSLSKEEAATLTFMREEEKLSRDIYKKMDEKWGLLPFGNIALAEQRHMDAIKAKLDKYGLPDPVLPEIGQFKDGELQQLYNELLAKGEVSYPCALQVGVSIEEMDIEDLENAIKATTHADLVQVYENLLSGSRNHLQAFEAWITLQGDSCLAQILNE